MLIHQQWSSIKQAAFATTSGEERVDFLSALGYNRSPEAIAGTLALYNNPALPLNNSERTLLLRSLLTHTEGVAATWKWLRKNWDKLAETQSTISGFSYLSLIVDALSTWQQFREVDEFFREKDTSVSSHLSNSDLLHVFLLYQTGYSCRRLTGNRNTTSSWIERRTTSRRRLRG